MTCTKCYHTATSVEVERVFSRGRLVLPHVRNRLSAENTRALMCVGEWSRRGLVEDRDILAVTSKAYNKDEEEDVESPGRRGALSSTLFPV